MSKAVLGFERKNIAVTSREILRCCQMISARMSKLYKYSLGQQLIMCASKLTSDVYAGLDEIGPSNRKLELVNRVNMDILELVNAGGSYPPLRLSESFRSYFPVLNSRFNWEINNYPMIYGRAATSHCAT